VFANNAFDDTILRRRDCGGDDQEPPLAERVGIESQMDFGGADPAAGRSSPARMRAMASRFSAPETATTTSGERAIARNVNVRRGCG
jgi:hypothetical protein